MNKLDGSDTIRYSALINGLKVVQMMSNGTTVPHITLKHWYHIVKAHDRLRYDDDNTIIDCSKNLKYNKKGMLRL